MTQKDRIRQALTDSRDWYTQNQLMDALQISLATCSLALAEMIADGSAVAIKPPPGFAKGVQKIYAAVGVEPPEGAAQLAGDKAAPRLPRKVRGFRAEAREKKRKGKSKSKSKPVARGALPVIKLKHGGALEARFKSDVAGVSPRWALASDGAFINLSTSREIDKHEARALISFVRTLDAREVAV